MLCLIQLIGVQILSNVLDRVVGRRVLTDEGYRITHPKAWTWYCSFMFLFGFISGLLSAVMRLVTLIVFCLCYLVRLDVTILPKKLAGWDAG